MVINLWSWSYFLVKWSYKFVHVVTKFAHYCTISLFMERILRFASLYFYEFYSQNTKKSTLVAVSALWRVPPTPNTSFFGVSMGCPGVPCSHCCQIAGPALFAPKSTVNTAGCLLHATPVESGNSVLSEGSCGAQSLRVMMGTHRLVPYTRHQPSCFSAGTSGRLSS